jgi:hypothetical protein
MTNQYHTRKLPGIVLATVCALFLTGCDITDRAVSEPSEDNEATGQVMSSPLPASPAISNPAATDANTLAPGTFDIRLHEGGVTLLANDVSARDILNGLAILAGFELLDAGTPMERVTLTIEGGDIHSVLVTLLKPNPYQIIYEFDHVRGGDALTRVVAGRLPTVVEAAPAPPPLPGTSSAIIIPEGAPLPDASLTALSAEDQVYLSLLLDPSPEVRADAAESITATGIALDYLARIITTDPSPEVRIATTYSLENSEDPRAVDTLIMGLNDTDPEVLVEVIDSLGFLDDRRTIPYLQPLLNHPDEDVRDAAESAIESLQ